MNAMIDDTVAAIATAPGVGAVSVIRVSGKNALSVVSHCFSRPKSLSKNPRKAILGEIKNRQGEVIDEVLAVFYKGPASYTGEDTVEISGHGGIYVTQEVLRRLLECGARSAAPGEFTQRAFLNEKMDLTQAEGVMDIISAQSALSLKAAQSQLGGSIQRVSQEMRQELIDITAHLEAFIDFPDEDIDPEVGEELVGKIRTVQQKATQLLSTSETGRLLREGARVVICGSPNAGKSSLLNTLLGYERAIVSEIKGTTRDTVEEVCSINGIPVRFIDTAGLRETEEAIEKQGIDRARQQMSTADLVIELVDGHAPRSEWEHAPKAQNTHFTVLTKKDLGIHESWKQEEIDLVLSNSTGEGEAELKDLIAKELLGNTNLSGSALVAINARHQTCLEVVKTTLDEAVSMIQAGDSSEFVSLPLRESVEAIGDLTGRIDTEEILGAIFGQFCLGK